MSRKSPYIWGSRPMALGLRGWCISTTAYVILCIALNLLWTQPASAFFPLGGFDTFEVLRFARWPLKELDTNNDGDVTNDEGLQIYVESGKAGFRPDEIQVIREAMDVWQDVPTSYMTFKIKDQFSDPIPVTLGDGLPTIQMQVTEDAVTGEDVQADRADVILGGLTYPVLGVTILLFTVEDVIIPGPDQNVQVAAGTILDADLVIDAASHRRLTGQTQALVSLKSTLVHELGHFIGLGHTPLNNLQLRTDPTGGTVIDLEENEVMWFTPPNGQARYIGVTPTMFPFAFAVKDRVTQQRRDGSEDLAPDDISGVSWLYPRQQGQENYFAVNSEARTRRRPNSGLPSEPIVGGHVVAWADADDNPDTPPVPVFSTMTGLYQKNNSRNQTGQQEGRFSLINVWKQMEVPGRTDTFFNPTYVFTLSPLNETGFERQAPPGITPPDVDSIQGTLSYSVTQRPTSAYDTVFMSETFHEVENIADVSRFDAGTKMIWSFDANNLVSLASGKTLQKILERRPMFGDPNDVCPLNVVAGGTIAPSSKQAAGADTLRRFRDTVLLRSTVGTILVDAYYAIAPYVARYLLDHTPAYRFFKAGVTWFYGLLIKPALVLPLLGGIIAVTLAAWAILRRRHKAVKIVAFVVLFLAVELMPAAHAGIIYQPTPEFIPQADAVVVGKVTATTYKDGPRGLAYTRVSLEVSRTVRGDINEGTTLALDVLGGRRSDGLFVGVSELPAFQQGEEIILALKQRNGSYFVYGGLRGKISIQTDVTTGQKYVSASAPEMQHVLEQDRKAIQKKKGTPESAESDGRIPLEDYVRYLERISEAVDQPTP